MGLLDQILNVIRPTVSELATTACIENPSSDSCAVLSAVSTHLGGTDFQSLYSNIDNMAQDAIRLSNLIQQKSDSTAQKISAFGSPPTSISHPRE